MDQWAFFDEVKAGTVRNAYLFYGPEAYIRKSALTTLQKKLLTPGLEDMNCTFMQNPTAQQIVEKTGVTYENDIAPGAFDQFINKLAGVPTTVFIDKNGKVVGEAVVGAKVEEYKQHVEDYLNEQK